MKKRENSIAEKDMVKVSAKEALGTSSNKRSIDSQ